MGLITHAVDEFKVARIPQILVVCDQIDTAPVWGYILQHQGLAVTLETSARQAVERWSRDMPDLLVIDVAQQDPVGLYKKFRAASAAPIVLFLPAHHEKQILEAYAFGVDDVVVKPVTPAIFLAKILAWVRRSWNIPADGFNTMQAPRHRLDPSRRSLIDPTGREIKLTYLEFRLLHLLMSRPTHLFSTQELIQHVWGNFGHGDHVVLKNVVYRLRRKIELDPSNPTLLQTQPGGYSFHE